MTLLLALLLAADPVTPPPQAPSLPAVVATPHLTVREGIDPSDLERYIHLVERAMSEGAKRVVLTIDSPGGSVGVTHNLVKLIDQARQEQGITTDCVVDGRAWSSALYLLQACDRRFMTKRSTLAAHEPINEGVTLSLRDLRSERFRRSMEVVSRAFAEQCASRMKVTVEQYLAKVHDDEWWMDWREALSVGAVDAVVLHEEEVWIPISSAPGEPG